MSHQKRLGILVGGGPAPGINSVIGAATIRAALEGVEVVGIQDGFEWHARRCRSCEAARHRRGPPDPLPRRFAYRHLARQPHPRSSASGEHGHLPAAPQRVDADHHRWRRHHSTRYAIARRYMIRLRRDDFDDAHELAKFAATCGLTLDQFRSEFGYLIENELPPLHLDAIKGGFALDAP